MKKFLAFIVVAVAMLAVPSVRAHEPVAHHPLVRSNIELLEAWIESQMAYKAIPGMCLAIVHDQDIVYMHAFGYADIEAERKTAPETLYRIASHSKLFTAISIMQLRDAGKLDLDDSVEKYLPWFKLSGKDTVGPPVSIRHLLTHSSGVPRDAGLPYWIDFKFPTTEEIIQRLPGQKTVFPTETEWKYSNLAFTLLGEVVAAVSGQPYEDYVSENIFQPLGMSNSGVTLSSIDITQLAKGYGRRLPDGSRQEMPVVDAKGMAAAAGITSSVVDMARFVSWQFRTLDDKDDEVLKPSTLREMQRIQWLDPKWTAGWGLAFHLRKTEDRLLVGHSGGYPGFKTSTYCSPDEKIGVIVFSNSLDAQPYPGEPLSVVDRAFEWVGDAIAKSKDDLKPMTPEATWKPLSGTYRNIWSDIQVLGLDGALVALDITNPNPKSTVSKLEPIEKSETTFRVMEGNPFFSLGDIVSFTLGEDGKAVRMMIGDFSFSRVE